MDTTNVILQLDREANEPAAQAERDLEIRGAGHPRDHPLEMEEGLAVAGRSGAGIREGPRRLERCRHIHGGAGNRWPECHRTQRLLPGTRAVS